MPATFPTPQAIIPTWNPAGISYSVTIARRNQIDPPRIVTLSGATTVFDARDGSAWGDKKVVTKLVLQNLSANVMYVALNMEAGSLDGEYHMLLPSGALGAQLDLSIDQPESVSVFGTDGDKVGVYIAYPKESQPI